MEKGCLERGLGVLEGAPNPSQGASFLTSKIKGFDFMFVRFFCKGLTLVDQNSKFPE